MPNATVVFDAIRYVDQDGTVQSADKGDQVVLSSDEHDRLSALGAVAKPGSKGPAPASGWPRTHEELDALAEQLQVTWPDGTKTVAQKVAALEAAGHTPSAAE